MLSRLFVVVIVAASVAHADPEPRPTFAVLHSRPGIDVVESINHASHIHGGAGAAIDHASINVRVKNAKPHTISVRKLELLRGPCQTTTWDSRKRLVVTGYLLHDWDTADPIATGKKAITVQAKPDLYQVRVAFDGVAAYQACDRFAFAIQLVVDGKHVAIEAPLEIKRKEPLRRDP